MNAKRALIRDKNLSEPLRSNSQTSLVARDHLLTLAENRFIHSSSITFMVASVPFGSISLRARRCQREA